MAVKAKWKYKLQGARSVTQRRPVVQGNTVLAVFNQMKGSKFQGTLISLDATTGGENWRFTKNHLINEPVVSADGFIYITSFDGSADKLTQDGSLCWNAHPPAKYCNVWKGVLACKTFVIPEIHGKARLIKALNCDNGDLSWTHDNE